MTPLPSLSPENTCHRTVTRWSNDTAAHMVKHAYLLCHGRREQHGLSVVGTQSDDLFHLLLEVLIEHPEGTTHNRKCLGRFWFLV